MQNQQDARGGSRKGWILGAVGVVVLVAGVFLVIQVRRAQEARRQEALAAAAAAQAEERPPEPIRGWHPSGTNPIAPMRPLPDPNPGWRNTGQSTESTYGFQVSAIRLSMANTIVDVRFKVTDVDKARKLADGKTTAYLVDLDTGAKLQMPSPPREGAFPPSSSKLMQGRTYFSMVSNQGGKLKSGSRVSLVMGDTVVTSLTVE
ncbi:MAG TPA: hypothetical protein DCM86_03060 [Verrucomicrobiales bacterium]|nr:hypothetical protein [Verrucomicrobiales bacterium]